jgi:hypothetical protein
MAIYKGEKGVANRVRQVLAKKKGGKVMATDNCHSDKILRLYWQYKMGKVYGVRVRRVLASKKGERSWRPISYAWEWQEKRGKAITTVDAFIDNLKVGRPTFYAWEWRV